MIVGLRPGLVIVALSLLTGALADPAMSAGNAPLDARLAARGIRDARVLQAFAKVPRDVFVPVNAAERAFDDTPLPGGYSQTISQPYLVARMVELLQLKPEDRVLEVGTGTGYPAAILAELAREVFSVGVIPELATTARLRVTREGYQNVHVKLGDDALGWREYAPYDAIVVTSIGARVPPALIEQLVEGGVLVMPVGPPRGRQVLVRGVRKGFKLHAKEVGELRAVSHTGRREGDERRRTDGAPSSSGRGAPADAVREGWLPQNLGEPRSDR